MELVISLLFVVLFLSESYTVNLGPNIIATKGGVWPKPQKQSKSNNFLLFHKDEFKFNLLSNNECTTLQDALARYQNIIASHYAKILDNPESIDHIADDENFVGSLNSLTITLDGICDDNEYPSMDMKEDYNLNVTSDTAHLSSKSLWGILRGLETFSQLLYAADDRESLRIDITTIVDFPRFPHRGLLLDTSRHFLPLKKIYDSLDAMAYNKFNVFHWHIVDDQSFPYVSQKFPELSEKAAYSPIHIYTPDDVKNVIEYARQRGIRVIPEFDTPGHTRSWGESHMELLTECFENGYGTGRLGSIDPSKEDTFTFMKAIFEEVGEVFPDPYIHIGGDETDFECWKSNPTLSAFMNQLGLKNSSDLQSYYIQKLIKIIDNQNLSLIVWQEVFDGGAKLPQDSIVQVWKDDWEATMQSVIGTGRRAILSSCWYLSALRTRGNWIIFYQCEPYNIFADEKQKRLILGGEACMWGESVNENNLISRVWPRASAIAERLWSAINTNDIKDAARRLEEHTCRMNRRGIEAQPPNGPGFCP